MSPRLTTVSELQELRQSLQESRDRNKPCVTVCAGTGCQATGASEVVEEFRKVVADHHLGERVEVRASGCHGFCERGPLVVIHPQRICYTNVEAKDVPEILLDTVLEGKVVDRLLYENPLTGKT